MELEKKLIDLQLLHCNDASNNLIQAYQVKVNHLLGIINIEKAHEPLKIFKKSHKKWENEINRLNNELMDTYKVINEEMDSIKENLKIIKEG